MVSFCGVSVCFSVYEHIHLNNSGFPAAVHDKSCSIMVWLNTFFDYNSQKTLITETVVKESLLYTAAED